MPKPPISNKTHLADIEMTEECVSSLDKYTDPYEVGWLEIYDIYGVH